jgi:hypothetical protein
MKTLNQLLTKNRFKQTTSEGSIKESVDKLYEQINKNEIKVAIIIVYEEGGNYKSSLYL